jgi:hypothetical protein
MSENRHVWEIKGITPLLHNNPMRIMLRDLKEKTPVKGENGTIKKPKPKTYTPEDEAEIRLYRPFDDGICYHQTVTFRAAVLGASISRKIGKISAKKIFAQAFCPIGEYIPVLDKDENAFKTWSEINYSTVCIRSMGKINRILRCRPQFNDWKMLLPVDVDEEVASLEQVTEILNLAGKLMGVGDFRPDPTKGLNGIGTYGKFIATLIE